MLLLLSSLVGTMSTSLAVDLVFCLALCVQLVGKRLFVGDLVTGGDDDKRQFGLWVGLYFGRDVC